MAKCKSGFCRTTIYIPEVLKVKAKITAAILHMPLSHLIRLALREKIKELEKKGENL